MHGFDAQRVIDEARAMDRLEKVHKIKVTPLLIDIGCLAFESHFKSVFGYYENGGGI